MNVVKAAMRIATVLMLGCGLAVASPAVASAATLKTPPRMCKLGAYLQGLHELRFADKTFNAEVWLWANCPDQQYEPLRHLWLLNAADFKLSDYYNENEPDGGNWSYILLTSKFRHNWNITNYPFDRHELILDVEDGDTTADKLRYLAEPSVSTANDNIELDTYKVVGLTVRTDVQSYRTSFGNPHLSDNTWRAPRLTVHIFLQHNNYLSFIKMATPVFAAFVIALLTFFLNMDSPPAMAGRLGMLGTALFAIVLNMRSASDALGSVDGITLIDEIHIVCLAFIVAALLVTVRSWQLHHVKSGMRVRRLNYWSAGILATAYVVLNSGLILMAAWNR